MIRTACLAAVAALLLSAPTSAHAYWGYGYGYGFPWGNNYGFQYSTGYVAPPPYYSIHPPVYYSPFITARHYGASPFAWYPGMSPITYLPEKVPMMITNPRAVKDKPGDDPQKVAATSEPQPLEIANPFVSPVNAIAGATP
jgi:hypothetical protein